MSSTEPLEDPAEPPRTVSLTARLIGALAGLLLLGAVAVALAALAYGRSAAGQAYDRLLIGAARQIASAITLRDGTLVVDLPVSAFELLALAEEDRIVYAVFAPDGRVVTGYDLARPPTDQEIFYDGEFGEEPVRFAVTERFFAERALFGTARVVVGQTTRARDELAREITQNALIVMGLAGLLMSALAGFTVRSALHPLRRIESAISGRSPTDLAPLTTPVPREVAGLVRAMNRFMARLGRQVEATRTMIADASHQLRTPVAALRVQADLAAEETDPERQRAIVARIHERSINLSRLTDQLLSHALIIHRADAVPREQLDLRAVAVRATEESDHDLFATEAVLRLDLPDDPVWCMGDALSLVEACKNLIFNAFRHGKPPVMVAVRMESDRAVLAVADCGPGIPAAHWTDAGSRFARSAGVSSTSAGLGLAIVQAVARSHHGALRFRRGAAGHFEAALNLPAAGGGSP